MMLRLMIITVRGLIRHTAPFGRKCRERKQFPHLAQQFLANQHDMVANYPYMFSRDGKMNMWGRSICYRFAATAPLSLWEYDKSGDVNYMAG